jgi:hypothetical protein
MDDDPKAVELLSRIADALERIGAALTVEVSFRFRDHQHSPAEGENTVVLLRSMESVRDAALRILRRTR